MTAKPPEPDGAPNHAAPSSQPPARDLSSGLGALVRLGRGVALVARHSWRRMQEHNLRAASASLAYRTIFAMVPALVLAFLVLKAAGVVEDGKRSLRQALETAGLAQISIRKGGAEAGSQPATAPTADTRPAAGPGGDSRPAGAPDAESGVFNLASEIESLVARVEDAMTFARLGPVGLVLLAWSAISLLTTIERALNRVFEAPSSRSLPRRVLLYWSAITFLPVVALAAGYLANAATAFVAGRMGAGGAGAVLRLAAYLVFGIVALACVFRFLPNTAVPMRSALIGAAVVVPLWIAARWGFGLYVSRFVTKGSVYGALGLLPLFFIWVNLCWTALLFGAEVAYVAGRWRTLEDDEDPGRLPLGGAETLSAALVVGAIFLLRQRPASIEEIVKALGLPEAAVRELLRRLTQGGVLAAVSGGPATGDPASAVAEVEAYVPARPLGAVRAQDVISLGPVEDQGEPDEAAARALRAVREKTRRALADVSLEDLLRSQ